MENFGLQPMTNEELINVEGGQTTKAGKILKAAADLVSWFAETFM